MQAIFSSQFLLVGLRKTLFRGYSAWRCTFLFGILSAVSGAAGLICTWIADRIGVYRLVLYAFATKLCVLVVYLFNAVVLSLTGAVSYSADISDSSDVWPEGTDSSDVSETLDATQGGANAVDSLGNDNSVSGLVHFAVFGIILTHETCTAIAMGYSNILLNNLMDEYEVSNNHVPPMGLFFSLQ